MGAFIKRVRKGRVAAPTTQKWSETEWQRGFDAAAPHDDGDRRLFESGRWFAANLAGLRTQAAELNTLGLGADELVRAAIAGANRNWILANDLMKPDGRAGDTVIAEQVIARRIRLEPWNIEVDPEGLIEASIDSLRHITFVSGPVASKRASVREILEALLMRSLVSSGYLLLESYWKDCLWSGWTVIQQPNIDVVQPTELRQAVATEAARFRAQTLRFSQYSEVERSWKTLPREVSADISNYRVVKEIRGTGRKLEIVTRRHAPHEVPRAHVMQMLGVGAWLDHLVDRELPQRQPLSLLLLLRAWDFVRSLAKAAQARMPKDTSIFEMSKLWSYAPTFESAVLVKALADALNVPRATSEAILSVLSMDSIKNADAWLTPLWKVAERYLLMLPVAITSNPKRLIDHWLTLGGVDLSIRGPLFEKYVRALCAEGIAESPVLASVGRCAPDAIELDPGVGDMDLVCAIGNTVLIGEVKCTTTPGSAVDRANYLDVLNQASEQIVTKIEHARRNVAMLNAATGWSLNNPSFVGVVVTDQEIGVGQQLNGIPVVDDMILTSYFNNPVLQHGVSFSPEGEKTVLDETRFYRTSGEAERNLAAYVRSPPQLRLALAHMKAVETTVLAAHDSKRCVHRDFAVSI